MSSVKEFAKSSENKVIENIDPRRRIVLEGTANFRDFGGYATRDGRHVAWQKLYRSGSLGHLSDADLDVVAALGISTICDFRNDDECAREPSRWPSLPEVRRVRLVLKEGDHALTLKRLLKKSGTVDVDQVVEFMKDINRDFVVRQSGVYAELMQQVLESSGPVLIHCTAGKDRTGFGAAVILSALGVDESQIMQDYLLTGHFVPIEEKVDGLMARHGLKASRDIGIALLGVSPAYLRGAFDAIETEYGGMETYLREGLALDASALRELRSRLLA
ncbi:Tyrosine-protein phosphatase precursor, putative [Ricinus communis]|uniref:Tyrosine-protein phosphatase, putative n=1 Tax=Ricinus communis TaxID=3988 RepID=B9THB6_RICCO|nr:Tyrosine-protein phosphatase precursor, putative [Ricinus communis]|eukprot:XP_002537635.1 uncharacterized protein LOC8278690 [Ricinus communis]